MSNRESIKNLLLDINETMKGSGLEYFLLHGTLLGYYRDKDIIPWDDDIDLGCLLDSKEVRETILEIFKRKDYVVSSWVKETTEFDGACNIVFTTNISDIVPKQGNLKNTTIPFTFKFIKRIADRAIESSSPVTYDWNDIHRLQQVQFYGQKFHIPAKPVNLFDIWYGKDCWKVPSRRAWIMRPREKSKYEEPIKFYHDQAMGYRAKGVIEALLKCDKDGNYIKPYEKTGKTPRGR